MGTLQLVAAGPEDLRPLDVERVVREARQQGWATAYRHRLLSHVVLAKETRHALVTRMYRETENRKESVSDVSY